MNIKTQFKWGKKNNKWEVTKEKQKEENDKTEVVMKAFLSKVFVSLFSSTLFLIGEIMFWWV